MKLIEMTGIPAATAFLIDGPSAFASGIDTTRPSGFEATAASINCDIATMSNFGGAWYSTLTPMSFAAASTPFFTTDQNGSEVWPCLTTTKRYGPSCAPLAAGINAATNSTPTNGANNLAKRRFI